MVRMILSFVKYIPTLVVFVATISDWWKSPFNDWVKGLVKGVVDLPWGVDSLFANLISMIVWGMLCSIFVTAYFNGIFWIVRKLPLKPIHRVWKNPDGIPFWKVTIKIEWLEVINLLLAIGLMLLLLSWWESFFVHGLLFSFGGILAGDGLLGWLAGWGLSMLAMTFLISGVFYGIAYALASMLLKRENSRDEEVP